MRSKLCLALAGCLSVVIGLPIAARAQQTGGAENLMFVLPKGFKQIHQARNQQQMIMEFVPEGETVKDWTEMVTLRVYFGVRNVDPRAVNKDMQERVWRPVCGRIETHEPALRQEKGYHVSAAVIDCFDPDPRKTAAQVHLRPREFMLMKVFQGRDSLYILQRAWHGTSGEQPPMMRWEELKKQWAGFMATAEICDTRIPDQPCGLPAR